MKVYTLYVPGKTYIHKMNPLTKLLYLAVAIAIPFIAPDPAITMACFLIGIFILGWAKVLHRVIYLLAMSILFISTIFIIQGLYYPGNTTPYLILGKLTFYKEGLIHAMVISFRLVNIMISASVLVLTTRPSDLISSAVRRGISPRLGYVMSSVLQIIPQMATTADTIMDAQKSRGLETEGNLKTRLKAYIPLLGPLVLGSLVSAQERAMALEVRAFNATGKRTFLQSEEDYTVSKAINAIIILALILTIIWRIYS